MHTEKLAKSSSTDFDRKELFEFVWTLVEHAMHALKALL